MAAVRVRFFALLRERLGPGDERAVPAGSTVADVWSAVRTGHADLDELDVRFAVNERYVDPDHALADGDELAIFPPVSGGC